jgi:hypothetical protein
MIILIRRLDSYSLPKSIGIDMRLGNKLIDDGKKRKMAKLIPNLIRVLLLGITVCYVGCAETKPFTYTGAEIQHGTGGIVERVENLDVYRSGSPNGTFRVLAVVENSSYEGTASIAAALSKGKAHKQLFDQAKALGADAIIMEGSSFETVGGGGGGVGMTTGTTYGNSFTGTTSTFGGSEVHGIRRNLAAIVKYVNVRR